MKRAGDFSMEIVFLFFIGYALYLVESNTVDAMFRMSVYVFIMYITPSFVIRSFLAERRRIKKQDVLKRLTMKFCIDFTDTSSLAHAHVFLILKTERLLSDEEKCLQEHIEAIRESRRLLTC